MMGSAICFNPKIKKERSDQIVANISHSINQYKLMGNNTCCPPSPLDPLCNDVNVHKVLYFLQCTWYFVSGCGLSKQLYDNFQYMFRSLSSQSFLWLIVGFLTWVRVTWRVPLKVQKLFILAVWVHLRFLLCSCSSIFNSVLRT